MTSWRKASRPVAGLEELAGRLQDRDREIIAVLGRHRVLTRDQIAVLFFSSASAARDRLTTLVELGVLTRYRSHNRQAWRYTLDYWGACVHAVATDLQAKTPTKKAVFDQATRTMHSSHRAHLEGANDFFIRLFAGCRARGGWEVEQWLSSAEASLFMSESKPRPDGGATITMNGKILEFWFEHDTGTEPLATLIDKARAYASQYAQPLRHQYTPVLVQFDKPMREGHFHHALTQYTAERGKLGFPIATTTTDMATDPTSGVWWLHGKDDTRVGIDAIPPGRERLDSLEFMQYIHAKVTGSGWS